MSSWPVCQIQSGSCCDVATAAGPISKEGIYMASIRKRGASYQITVSNGRRPDGSQILETKTYTPEPGMTQRQIEKAVEECALDFERAVKAGKSIKGERLTLLQLANQFLDDMEPAGDPENDAMALTTWSAYRSSLRQRIVPRLGHLKIANITPKTLKDYSKELRQDGSRMDGKPGGLAESSITKDCAIISSLLSYAVGEGLLPINPIIYSGKQKRSKKAPKEYKVDYLTLEQVQWLLWALDSPIQLKHKAHDRIHKNGKTYHVPEYTTTWQLSLMWRAYFYLALFAGDRRGENISLTWEDIDLDTGAVNISKSTAYAERQIVHKSTKTNRSRTPVVPSIVTNVLWQWKNEQKQRYLEQGSYWKGYRGKQFDKNYIFIQEDGKQVHPSTPYHQFKRIIQIYNQNVAQDEEHQIPPSTTPHDLRHTAASILISNNMDPRSVAGVLGHSNATTTLNIYSYFFKTKNQEAADIMAGALCPDGAAPRASGID